MYAMTYHTILSPYTRIRVATNVATQLTIPGLLAFVDGPHTWSFLDQALCGTYKSQSSHEVELSIIVLTLLQSVLREANSSILTQLSSGLIYWISDKDNVLEDNQYNEIIVPLYEVIIAVLRRMPVEEETLLVHSDLLCSITGRIASGAQTFKILRSFWKNSYAGVIPPTELPDALRVILFANSSGDELSEESDAEEYLFDVVDTAEEEGEETRGAEWDSSDSEAQEASVTLADEVEQPAIANVAVIPTPAEEELSSDEEDFGAAPEVTELRTLTNQVPTKPPTLVYSLSPESPVNERSPEDEGPVAFPLRPAAFADSPSPSPSRKRRVRDDEGM